MANFINKSTNISNPDCIASLEKLYNRLFNQPEEIIVQKTIRSPENLKNELMELIDGTVKPNESCLDKILQF